MSESLIAASVFRQPLRSLAQRALKNCSMSDHIDIFLRSTQTNASELWLIVTAGAAFIYIFSVFSTVSCYVHRETRRMESGPDIKPTRYDIAHARQSSPTFIDMSGTQTVFRGVFPMGWCLDKATAVGELHVLACAERGVQFSLKLLSRLR